MEKVTSHNITEMVSKTSHAGQVLVQYLVSDLKYFLEKNPAVMCSVVSLNIDNKGQQNVF